MTGPDGAITSAGVAQVPKREILLRKEILTGFATEGRRRAARLTSDDIVPLLEQGFFVGPLTDWALISQ
jgi:hypothetical protein